MDVIPINQVVGESPGSASIFLGPQKKEIDIFFLIFKGAAIIVCFHRMILRMGGVSTQKHTGLCLVEVIWAIVSHRVAALGVQTGRGDLR